MLTFQGFDENKYGVTIKSQRTIAELQKSDEYGEDDSYAIYEMLINNMKPVDFGYYLKRYVLQVAVSDKTIYALLSDGTVFTTDQGGKTMPWNNIICIAACRGLFAAVDRKGILHTDTSLFCGKAWNEMKLQIPE